MCKSLTWAPETALICKDSHYRRPCMGVEPGGLSLTQCQWTFTPRRSRGSVAVKFSKQKSLGPAQPKPLQMHRTCKNLGLCVPAPPVSLPCVEDVAHLPLPWSLCSFCVAFLTRGSLYCSGARPEDSGLQGSLLTAGSTHLVTCSARSCGPLQPAGGLASCWRWRCRL